MNHAMDGNVHVDEFVIEEKEDDKVKRMYSMKLKTILPKS
jgi:hypothetical protein